MPSLEELLEASVRIVEQRKRKTFDDTERARVHRELDELFAQDRTQQCIGDK